MHELDVLPPPGSYLFKMLEKVAVGLGTCFLLVTIFASWSPPGLRPVTSFSVGWEHIAAFGILGGCWGFAFPRRTFQLMLLLVMTAIILEVGQIVVPGRHARLIDVATKIVGAGVGTLIALLIRTIAQGDTVRTFR